MNEHPEPSPENVAEVVDLAKHAAGRAVDVVGQTAVLGPAPAMPGIFFNAAFALLDEAARITVAVHLRTTEHVKNRLHPANVEMFLVMARAMTLYPDLDAVTKMIAAHANSISKDGRVRAVGIGGRGEL